MPHREQPPPAMLPGTYVMDQATVDRLASTAALAAARAVQEDALTKDDVEEIVEEGIKRFVERVGIDDVPEFRKDLTAMRAARETREALIQHGIKAVLTVLLGGVCTAIWLAIKGAK